MRHLFVKSTLLKTGIVQRQLGAEIDKYEIVKISDKNYSNLGDIERSY